MRRGLRGYTLALRHRPRAAWGLSPCIVGLDTCSSPWSRPWAPARCSPPAGRRATSIWSRRATAATKAQPKPPGTPQGGRASGLCPPGGWRVAQCPRRGAIDDARPRRHLGRSPWTTSTIATGSCTPRPCRWTRSPSASGRPATSTPGPPWSGTGTPSTAPSPTSPHLICFAVKANANLAVLNCLARLGSGLRHRLRGRTGAGAGGGRRPGQGDLLRGRQARGRDAPGPGGRHPLLQRGVGGRTGAARPRSPANLGWSPRCRCGSIRTWTPAPTPTSPPGSRRTSSASTSATAAAVYRRAAALPHLRVTGIDCHIGSQLTDLAPFLDALDRVLALADRLAEAGIAIEHLDLGGGLGIRYTERDTRRSRPPMPPPCSAAWAGAATRSSWSPGAPSSATPASC